MSLCIHKWYARPSRRPGRGVAEISLKMCDDVDIDFSVTLLYPTMDAQFHNIYDFNICETLVPDDVICKHERYPFFG